MPIAESISTTQACHWLGWHLLVWLVAMGGFSSVSYAISAPGLDWVSAIKAMATMIPYTFLLTYLALYGVLPLALAGRYDRIIRFSLLLVVGSRVLMALYRGYSLTLTHSKQPI